MQHNQSVLIEDDANAWTVGITRETIQRIIACRNTKANPGDMIALWMFYAYTARWQNVNRPRSTTSYTAKGLNWSVARVRRTKSGLKSLNLIRDIVTRDANSRATGWYVQVFHLAKPATSHPNDFSQGGEPKDKCSRRVPVNAQGNKTPETQRDGRLAPTDVILLSKRVPAGKLEALVVSSPHTGLTPPKPPAVHELVAFALCQEGFKTSQVLPFVAQLDLHRAAHDILDGLRDDLREPVAWAFRFLHYNNMRGWPLNKTWRAAFQGFRACDRGDGASDVPLRWLPCVTTSAETETYASQA